MTITMYGTLPGNNSTPKNTNYTQVNIHGGQSIKFSLSADNINSFFIAEEGVSCKVSIGDKEGSYKTFLLCLKGSNVIVNEINDHVIVMGEGICKMTDGTTVEKTSADDSSCQEYISVLKLSEESSITSLTEITGPYETIHCSYSEHAEPAILGADLSNE